MTRNDSRLMMMMMRLHVVYVTALLVVKVDIKHQKDEQLRYYKLCRVRDGALTDGPEL